jgi:hypothetical protein
MVRNNESWELGEPELNERGQPVIHDIASKLGCIRPSPDLPYSFPEGAEDFAELQAQLQAARSEMTSDDAASRKHSTDLSNSPTLDRADRASSTESDHSTMSKEYNQMMWNQGQATKKAALARPNRPTLKPTPLSIAQRPSVDESPYQTRASLDTSRSEPSPVYTDFQTESPMLRNPSPFSPWSGGDDFFGPVHALDLTAHYMRQQQPMSQSSPLGPTNGIGMQADFLKMQQYDGLPGMNFAEGTIRPNMLDCNTQVELFEQMDVMYSADYENQLAMA